MRSGAPDALDLMVAVNFANMALDLIDRDVPSQMVALRSGTYTSVPIDTMMSGPKRVDVDALYDEKRYRPSSARSTASRCSSTEIWHASCPPTGDAVPHPVLGPLRPDSARGPRGRSRHSGSRRGRPVESGTERLLERRAVPARPRSGRTGHQGTARCRAGAR